MKAFFHPKQREHHPRFFLSSGRNQSNPEVPDRIDVFLSALDDNGLSTEIPSDRGLGPVAEIHTPEYIDFLKHIFVRWQRIEDASEEVVPNVHPNRNRAGYPRSAVGQAGYHQADTSCPISRETWDSAYWSAQTAMAAAAVIDGGSDSAYALCRPPGHHAFRDGAAGFCYLNNSAIAAQWLVSRGHSTAILDIDLHHGNGTQEIFYDRSDVLTISVHADPVRFYPFFWGYEQERGQGRGLGANLNIPLPRGTTDDGFMLALRKARQRLDAFCPDVLVVAAGLDPYRGDPLAGFAISSAGFSQIGMAIAGIGIPTVFVQEGGYICPALGQNLSNLLRGFLDNR